VVTVLFFGAVRERLRMSQVELATPADVNALLAELTTRHPELSALLPALRVAVNQEFADGDVVLRDGDEVALIPPVSGGSAHCRVSDQRLSLDEVVSAVSSRAAGGIATFTGVVREHSRGKRVLRLEYEAYVPMAERKMAEIARVIEQEIPGAAVAMVHRIGTLDIGEAAVVIAAAAAHRSQAFDACRLAIDRLKESVPIWKKEFYDDGEQWIGLGP
jgi:MoaE-MoaD fusion protein